MKTQLFFNNDARCSNNRHHKNSNQMKIFVEFKVRVFGKKINWRWLRKKLKPAMKLIISILPIILPYILH